MSSLSSYKQLEESCAPDAWYMYYDKPDEKVSIGKQDYEHYSDDYPDNNIDPDTGMEWGLDSVRPVQSNYAMLSQYISSFNHYLTLSGIVGIMGTIGGYLWVYKGNDPLSTRIKIPIKSRNMATPEFLDRTKFNAQKVAEKGVKSVTKLVKNKFYSQSRVNRGLEF